MLLEKRLDDLTRLIQGKNMDGLVIGASGDLAYLTGLSPLSDERFKGLVVLKDKSFFYICPELYYEETLELLGEDVDIFVWGDGEGFLKAIEKANKAYHLENMLLGVNDAIRAVDMLQIQDVIDVKFTVGSPILEEIRIIKDEQEIGYLKKAAEIADKTATEILNHIRPGISEKDIKDKIEELLMEFGGEGLAFETIVASGPNSSRPHYNDDKRIIQEQDVMVLDFGCKYKGYCSDISRTVFVGEPTSEQRKVYEIVLKANTEAEKAAREGVTAHEVDKKARDIIKEAGYGQYFINRTGHGIGMDVHEGPYIREGNDLKLRNGMAFSIEPGIYIPDKFGMRVEDIVVIENGVGVPINKASKEMKIV